MFSIADASFPPCRAPHHPSSFGLSDRTGAFQESVHCSSPVGGRFTPVSATKSPLQPPRLQTQSPVHPLHMFHTPTFRRSLEGASRDAPHGGCEPHPHRLRSEEDRRGIRRRAMFWVSRAGDSQRRRPVTPASVSVSEGRNAPPLQSPFPGPNVIETPLRPARRCHAPRLAMSLRSGTHLFEKCSLVTSCRGAICPCPSYEITTLAALLRNSNSCTPPALRGRSPFRRSLQGAPVCAPFARIIDDAHLHRQASRSATSPRPTAEDEGGAERLSGPDSGLRPPSVPPWTPRLTKCNFQSWRCPLRARFSDCTSAIPKAVIVR